MTTDVHALVVDDEPDICELLAMTLSRMDIATDTAGDVAKGLAQAWNDYAARNALDTTVLAARAYGSGLVLSSGVTDGSDSLTVNLNTVSADAGCMIGRGLESITDIDVTTNQSAVAGAPSVAAIGGAGLCHRERGPPAVADPLPSRAAARPLQTDHDRSKTAPCDTAPLAPA